MILNQHRRHARPTLDLLLCLFALVLQALAWASMPLPRSSASVGGEWLLVCSAEGVQRLSLAEFKARAGQNPDQQDPPGQGGGHGCALCPLVTGLALQPAWPRLPEGAPGQAFCRRAATRDLRITGTFDTSQARAPPAIG
ncbi:DUF2946 family protein [Pseudomonas sp. LD120]|uniref:DUF2946 family protein n=1 Tax=Pseudomonas sp. LD120 TaxID=485751 RepID=UPI00135C31C3|nr:DUF2946 family protein [Pseudomonas sp. LD120]KAF0866575.1 hypothetical protein PLD_04600 [Pseudomonas sp. LD120]